MNNAGKIIQLLNPTNAQDAATKSYVDTSIPIGGIIMWSGAGFTLPSNWKLCDGTTYGSVVTPNLIGRFVKGASSLGVSRLENNSVGTGDIIKAGNDILGNLSYEYFGASVSISADGTTVAVGAYGNNGFTGVTRVYKYNATGEWSQLGPTISGVDYGEQSGYSVSLSADGTTLAVGAYGNNGFTGVTRVYKYNATTGQWPQLGSTISGVDNGERSGAGVSISADGTTVAVGAYLNSTYKGVTRVYRYNGSTWPQLGPNILGDGTQELSGHSVSLSADGTTVAVGAYGNSSYKGVTRVYRYNGSTWPQLGPTISGVDNEEQSGWSVSLSADGNTVAVGAFGNGDNKGVTRIYRYNATTGQWPQFGQNILGDGTVEYFGYSVSISADGNTVAVGAQQANNTRGVTRVYKYNATTDQWPQLGPNILGDGTVEQSGYSVSISADGTTVAVGAPNNSSGRGVTRVYLFSNIYVLAFIMRVS
jgi:hypothetical protein